MKATLNAALRSERGKNAARRLRASGRVPAILYGHGDETQALAVDALELEKLLASISVENTLIDLSVDGKTTRALIREVQMHPYKSEVLHLDLLHIHAGEKLRLQVPVRLTGTPVGVRNSGGVLDHVLYDLEVECLPKDIPDAAEVDVSGLDVGESIRVREVEIPNVKVLNDPDLPIASVVAPTVAKLPEAPEEEEGAVEEVEPELIRRRDEDADETDVTEQG